MLSTEKGIADRFFAAGGPNGCAGAQCVIHVLGPVFHARSNGGGGFGVRRAVRALASRRATSGRFAAEKNRVFAGKPASPKPTPERALSLSKMCVFCLSLSA